MTQIKSPGHKIIKEFLLKADWEGGAPEIWEKGRTAGTREVRESQSFAYGGCEFDPQQCFSLISIFLSLSLPLSLESINIFSGEDFKNIKIN